MRAFHLHRAPTGRGLKIRFGLFTDNQSHQLRYQRSEHAIIVVFTTWHKHKKTLQLLSIKMIGCEEALGLNICSLRCPLAGWRRFISIFGPHRWIRILGPTGGHTYIYMYICICATARPRRLHGRRLHPESGFLCSITTNVLWSLLFSFSDRNKRGQPLVH